MWLCLYFPSLFYSVTGIDLYNSTDSIYSMSLFEIRKICANVLLYLLIYLSIFIQYRLKLSIPILNKPIMAATCVVVKGGFEGLGDPALDVQPTKPSRSFLEIINSKDCLETLPRLNSAEKAVSAPYPPEAEGSNAIHAKPSTESTSTSGYPFWPRTTPAVNIPTLPETESNSEPVPTNEGNNKKVRIKGYVEVKQITEGGLEKNNDDLIEAGPKKKLQSSIKQKYTNAYDCSTPLRWHNRYPLVDEANRPEIEIVYQKLEVEELKYKSSSSLPETNMENNKGQIKNPSATSNIAVRTLLKNILKKFK